MSYRAPIRDLSFCLTEVVGVDRLTAGGGFPDFDRETMAAILDAAGQFSSEVLAPLNRIGDQQGARYANGRVTTPAGFPGAYRAFAGAGWNSLDADPAYGGQGLPKALALAVFETIHSANMAFGLCPLLSHGAIEALHAHGSERLKGLYLPRLISGEWTGTMNLTEPQSGSDLAHLRTRAEPDGDGGYRLTGSKIYITWGDHDCADNIVHLVLARLPDAPEGVRGISLFVAPKRLVADDGSLGEPNDLRPGGIEHKLGIHASPTCTMLFEGAHAELVGQPGQGLPHMFTMMNSARLNVGMEGVGIAERAYQQALAYALDRRQGRSAWTGEHPAPIFDHPDVRRSLVLMKARIEAARALCLETAVNADLARVAASPEAREAARLREELLVPVAKAWSTDMGVEIASQGLQIHGGMGFIEDTGAAQHYRDARIAPIYEGTNGVQAIDLMGRKLGLGGGAAVRTLITDIRAVAAELSASDDEWLHAPGARLAEGADAVETATDWLIERKGHAQPDALSGATPYLTLLGDVAGGWFLARGALAAAKLEDRGYARTKVALLRVYADQVLARARGWCAAVTAGAAELQLATADALGA
jgi:alkylation response protein AidB-like acyl-CoA dehydrogenase